MSYPRSHSFPQYLLQKRGKAEENCDKVLPLPLVSMSPLRTGCGCGQDMRDLIVISMDKNVKFPEYVVLVDTAFLQRVVRDVRTVMSGRLGRQLPPLDLPLWLTCLLLDAGVRGADNNVQILLADGSGKPEGWEACCPSSRAEVDGKACRTALGELSFSVVSAEGLASSQNLYEDLMRLVLNDTAVKRLLLVPAPGKDDWAETLSALQKDLGLTGQDLDARVCLFGMEPPRQALPCPWLPLAYPLAHTLGIREDELK